MSAFESSASELRRSLPAPRVTTQVNDLFRMAEASRRGLVPDFSSGSVRFVERGRPAYLGSQEIVPLSNDLVLVTTDLHGFTASRNEHELRGWLYLHFRLDGSSTEAIPGRAVQRIDRECFLLCTTAQPRPLVRELLGDTWRTIGIACRPAFAQQELGGLANSIPEELRRFRAGDEIDFSYVGTLTNEMRAAAQSLLRTSMPDEIRNVYLKAKVVELVCLALAGVRARAEIMPELSVRLRRRDIDCVHRARSLILANASAPSLSALAREVGINRNKLAVGFKHLFGVTVGEFGRQQKLMHARTLLERDGLAVSHVASLAGYADPGSFSKAFKLAYGVLPSEICATSGDRQK